MQAIHDFMYIFKSLVFLNSCCEPLKDFNKSIVCIDVWMYECTNHVGN